jgi:hypothetical protein
MKLTKHRIVVYRSDGTPFDLTRYVSAWSIENGDVNGSISGLDGVVQIAKLTINNDINYNFNPGVMYWKPKTLSIDYKGNSTNTYDIPTELHDNNTVNASITFVSGQLKTWDELSNTWSSLETAWKDMYITGTENDKNYQEIIVQNNQIILGKTIPTNVSFTVTYNYIDFTEYNPINYYNGVYNPLFDENTKIEIYALQDDVQYATVETIGNGTNYISYTTTQKIIEDSPSIIYAENGTYTATGYWDSDNNRFVFGATIPAGENIKIGYSYYTEDFEMLFSGYVGDSIEVSENGKQISLTCRDKAKILQDTYIDRKFVNVDIDEVTRVDNAYFPFAADGTDTITGDISGFNIGDIVKIQNIGNAEVLDITETVSYVPAYTLTLYNKLNNVISTTPIVYDDSYEYSVLRALIGNPLIKITSTNTNGTKIYTDKKIYGMNRYPQADVTGKKAYQVYLDTNPEYVNTTYTLEVTIEKVTTGLKLNTTIPAGTVQVAQNNIRIQSIIQNVLNQTLGAQAPLCFLDVNSSSADSNLSVTDDNFEKKSVWDALQGIVLTKALRLGFIYNEQEKDFVLTLTKAKDKTTADYQIKENGITSQTLTVSGNSIRNAVLVSYIDETTGKYNTVSAIDENSITAYGRRATLITEANTSSVNSQTRAQEFANEILKASKDRIIETKLTCPFFYKVGNKRLDLGDTLAIDHKYIENGDSIPFYAVESIKYSWSATEGYVTELAGNKQKVRPIVKKFRQLESRPGKFRQINQTEISQLYELGQIQNLKVTQTGLEGVALTPKAYAYISFERPLLNKVNSYQIEVKKQSENWENADTKVINSEENLIQTKLILDVQTDYDVRVTPYNAIGAKGVDATLQISAIGDDTIPADVTGVNAVGESEQINVSFNANTENDLLGYRIYVKKDSAPTKTDYDFFKQTNSTDTAISGLGTDPGEYYVGVTAYDTSGNESELTNIVNVYVSPKFVIRTQADLDEWLTKIDTDYDVVEFYPLENNGSYLIDSSYGFTITKEKLIITGNGAKINLSARIDIDVSNLIFDNLIIEKIDTVVTNRINFYNLNTTPTGKNQITNCTFIANGDIVVNFKKHQNVSNCLFKSNGGETLVISGTFDSYGIPGETTLTNCIFENISTFTYSKLGILSAENVTIKNCSFKNTVIEIYQNYYVSSNISITNNSFLFTSVINIPKYIFGFYSALSLNAFKNLLISKNIFKQNDDYFDYLIKGIVDATSLNAISNSILSDNLFYTVSGVSNISLHPLFTKDSTFIIKDNLLN